MSDNAAKAKADADRAAKARADARDAATKAAAQPAADRAAASRGAQRSLDPDSEEAIAARGGAADTMEGNIAARDAAVAKQQPDDKPA